MDMLRQGWTGLGMRSAFAVLTLISPLAGAQEQTGTPWTGLPAIMVSTDELMAQQRALDARVAGTEQPVRIKPLRRPDRENLPSGPDQASASPALAAAPGRAGPLAAQTASTPNFLGASLTDSFSPLFPPDTMGAVGPTQFIVAINGHFKSFNKTTGVADGALNVDPDVFFASQMTAGGFTSDPRVRYDRLSGRWFIVMIDVPPTIVANKVMLAVSDTGTISGATVWSFYSFVQSTPTPAGDAGCLADYPTLGVDVNALYIGTNMFCGAGWNTFGGTTGFVVRKSSITGGGPIVVTAFRQLTTAAGAGPYTPQGVDNYDPAATEGYFIGVDNATFSTLMLRRIATPGGTPTISANVSITVATTAYPLTVPHSGNTGGANGKLDALDDRLFAAHIRNGKLWTAHNIAVNTSGQSTGTKDRDGVRWYELSVPVGSGTPTVTQTGTVFDPTATVSNPAWYWIPSIMVTGQGHAAVGFSSAGNTSFTNAAFAGRLAGDAANTMQAVTPYTTNTFAYNPPGDSGGASGRRWGDYSYTSLDPDDDMTLWTIQEYASALNVWGVRVARLLAPPPAAPASVSPASAAVGQASVNLVVTGTSAGGSGFFDPGAGFIKRIAATIPGVTVNSITYTDPTHVTVNVSTVGATAGAKNVTITNPDGQAATGTGIFSVTGGVAPVLQSAVLRRVHGAAGTFDLPLTLTTPPTVNHNPTTEPRTGTTHQIVFTYDKPLSTATVNVTEGTAVKSSSLVGSTVVVDLTGVTNAQYVTVSLTSVGSTDGGTGGIGEARVGFLEGDVNQSHAVTVADLGLVNAQLAQPVTAANFLKDVNASGTLTVADKGITNSRLTNSLPTP